MCILYLAPPLDRARAEAVATTAHAHSIDKIMSIPVVDLEGVFSVIELGGWLQVDQIHSAFSTVGFVFIKNHGIARKTVRAFTDLCLRSVQD